MSITKSSYVSACRVCGALRSKRMIVFPLPSVSVHLTVPIRFPKFISHEFVPGFCILSKRVLLIFWILFVVYSLPYPFSGVMISVLFSHFFIPMRADSIPEITSPDPTVIVLAAISNKFLFSKEPVIVKLTVSHV